MRRAQLLAALAAVDRLRTTKRASFADHLFGPQRASYEDRRRIVVIRAGRRGGKSTGLAARALRGVQGRPGTFSLYLTLTRKNAKRLLLPPVRKLLTDLGVPHKINLTDLEVHIAGGGTLWLGGIDTDDQIEKYRGPTYVEAIVDECQSFPSDRLQALHNDILRPATIDHRGTITFAGTPGYVPAGYWYDLSGPKSRHKVEGADDVHYWTAYDNPHLGDVEQELADIRAENGWDVDHPTYVREYLGHWVVDPDALVYPYDDARNGIEIGPGAHGLPTTNIHGDMISPAAWRYVLSVDVGEIHATAFVVVATHPDLPEDFVIHAEKMLNMRTDRMAQRIRDLRTLFPGVVVMDTQGIGKRHADEIRSRFKIPIEAADKQDKASGIRIARDRLLSGRTKFLRGPSTAPLRSEMQVVLWNDKHDDHARDQEDHCCDAFIYGLRRHRHYRAEDRDAQLEYGSAAWHEAEQRRILERRMRKARHAREAVDPWER